jgi:hypothetical protein
MRGNVIRSGVARSPDPRIPGSAAGLLAPVQPLAIFTLSENIDHGDFDTLGWTFVSKKHGPTRLAQTRILL